MTARAASSASRPAIIAAHLYRREREEKSLTQRENFDFHCLPSSLSSDDFKIVILSFGAERRAISFDDGVHRLSPGKAGMDGRVDHLLDFFADRQRDGRGAGESRHDKTGTADYAFPAVSAVPVCLSPYLIISYCRLIRRLNNDDQPGFDVGLDF